MKRKRKVQSINPIKLIKPLSVTLLFFLLIGVVACSDSSTGTDDNGNNNGDPNGNEIGPEPTFTNVQMIFNENCGSCHIGGSTNGVRLDSYNNVIESVGDQYGIAVIQPNDADGSPLVDKIESNPDFGDRMPQGGPFLSTERINQIREWIDNGAQNN